MKKKGILLILMLLAAAAVWGMMTYCMVDGTLYRRDTVSLDLRGQQITASHYEKLKRKLPAARIQWDVPFQDGYLAEDTTELTVQTLSEEDAGILAAYLPRLRKVNGESCTDYASLALLKKLRPGVQVDYWVHINGRSCAGNALQVILEDPSGEDLARMEYLPQLQMVTVTGGSLDAVDMLKVYAKARNLTVSCRIQGVTYSADTTVLDIAGITDRELPLLNLMPKLRRVHLTEPEASGEALTAMREARVGMDLQWEKTLMGLTFSSKATQIDLTEVLALKPGQRPGTETNYQKCAKFPRMGTDNPEPTAVKLLDHAPLPDKSAMTPELIREAEEAMAYFPDAKKLVMVGCYLDNEKMDAFRMARQEDYEVVWMVECGKLASRTDAKFFMPTKYRVYYFRDFQMENLQYLHDVVALDLGHMYITHVEFVEHMPNLEYVVLAHSDIRSVEPLRSCKKLKFLEIDWTPVRDFSPLEDCTALEDLNIGNTWADTEPLKKLTWLKNLWMVDRTPDPGLAAALPGTHVQTAGGSTVDAGWRELPNYYAMRDALKMFYMGW